MRRLTSNLERLDIDARVFGAEPLAPALHARAPSRKPPSFRTPLPDRISWPVVASEGGQRYHRKLH